jgi:SecD/SecF fusion protein
LFLVLVLILAISSAFTFWHQVNNGQIQYGLDVRGGVRFTYQMMLDQLEPEQRERIGEIRSNMQRIMANRVGAALGVVEGNVQLKEPDQLIVELPGFTDVDTARRTLQSTASIRAYHATNVVTTRAGFRAYTPNQEEMVDGAPVITFSPTRDPERILRPGDPEYERMIAGWTLILEGDDLASAQAQVDGQNTIPFFQFSREGSRKIEQWSRRVANRGENIAFVLDGRVLNIAPLRDGVILDTGNAIIEGRFDPQYVVGLVELLNAGALPIELQETSSSQVDPTLGAQALNMMVFAGLISFGVIVLFLLVYYVFPGLVALFALCLYVLFTLTVLTLLGATFSLAAIAGFILSVGMAVDANILVFERVKEEMRAGRELMKAVEVGFKRAFPAILDSNMCTILTSTVLFWFGTGPVKGFASTLIIGVAISLFTAVAVTRSLLVFLVGSGIGRDPKWFGLDRQWFGEYIERRGGRAPLKIVQTSRKWFLISLATIIPGSIFMFMGGLKPNVEFRGGFEITLEKPEVAAPTPVVIEARVRAAGHEGSRVTVSTTADGRRQAIIQVPESPALRAEDPNARNVLAEAAGFDPEDIRSFDSVGPLIQAETIRNAIYGVIFSVLLIVSYLTLRFGFVVGSLRNGFRFGMSAVGALVHDVLVVLGVAAIVGYFMNWQISALFITAMLTVIGFSVHDTVVIFDRVRENLRRPLKGETFADLCNRSITQSFARSINTSMTVIATLTIMIFWGTATPELKFFCLAMLTGIVSGTYSSIYNATPILYLWDRYVVKRRGEEYGLMVEAARENERVRAAALRLEVAPAGFGGPVPSSAQRGYGTTKRRRSAVERATHVVDDDDDEQIRQDDEDEGNRR